MKKLYYLMLMVCTVFAFTACSDDDDDNGDNPPQIPVTEYSVPAQGEIGGPVTIKGKGYTAGSKIFLKDTKTEVEATVTAHTAVDLVFTVPGTLTAGNYTVVLNQAGGKWDLGSIALIAANPVKDFEIVEKSVKAGETVNVKGTGWADDCQIYLLNAESESTDVENFQKTANGIQFTIPASVVAGPYTVMLKQAGDWSLGTIEVVAEGPKKLRKVEADLDGDETIYELFYNEDGTIKSVHAYQPDGISDQNWEVTYSEGSVTLVVKGKNSGNEDVDNTTVYTVVDGVATESYMTDATKGNARTNYTWNFTGNYLTDLSGGEVAVTYTYDNDRLTESTCAGLDDLSFDNEQNKTGDNNFAGIDGLAFVLHYWGYSDFEARLLGLTGKSLTVLPSALHAEWEGYNITYAKTGDLITEMKLTEIIDDEVPYVYTYKFIYE